jgi:hypothetical protein
MVKSRGSILLLTLVVPACDVQHGPLSSIEQINGPSVNVAAIGSANGDGSFNIGAPGADIGFVLNAVSRADGSATGSVQYGADLTAFGLGTIEMQFDVTCLSRDPDLGRAWIAGVVTVNNSTNPTFATDPKRQVGRDVWFRIADNGNGGSGTLDRSTQLGFEGSGGITTSLEYCATKPWLAEPAHPVTIGNISVR